MVEHHSKEHVLNIEIYTDGSLKKVGINNTFGGWAFIVVKDSKKIYYDSGSEHGTTNQRMELQAIYEALKYATSIRRNCDKVIIYSDSAYAINCYQQEWYIGWQANGWINSKGQDVANRDLWEKIIPFFDNFWYTFRKVPGHSGVFWNEECDELAQTAADKLKRTWQGAQHE